MTGIFIKLAMQRTIKYLIVFLFISFSLLFTGASEVNAQCGGGEICMDSRTINYRQYETSGCVHKDTMSGCWGPFATAPLYRCEINGCNWRNYTSACNMSPCQTINPAPDSGCTGGATKCTSKDLVYGCCSAGAECSCTGWVNGACGGSCPPTERLKTQTCTPAGCDKESKCVTDASCGGGGDPPTCDSWTNMDINGCSLAEWTSVPKGSDCTTSSDWVTLNMSVGNSPTHMEFVNANTAANCKTSNFEGWWVDYQVYNPAIAWHIVAGDGNKKVCGRFHNADGSVQCGGMITLEADAGPATPNCKDLTCPAEIELETTGTFTATYEHADGPVDNRGLAIYPSSDPSCTGPAESFQTDIGGPGIVSFNWKPTALGTYNVDCRAWNDAIAECRGRCTGDPPYACAGPNTSCSVKVVPPIAPEDCPIPGVAGSSTCDDGTDSGSVTCSWGGLAKASTYLGQIDGDGNINTAPRDVDEDNSSTSRTASNLSAGVYQCRARIETGTCDAPGLWSTIQNVTVDSCPVDDCPAPGSLSGTPFCDTDDTSDIDWIWSSVPGALEYRFQTDRNSAFDDSTGNRREINNISDLFHTTNNHAEDVDIWGRVRVEDSDGSCTVDVNAWKEIGPIRTEDCHIEECDISINFSSPMYAFFQEPIWATALSEVNGFIKNIVFSSSHAIHAYIDPSSRDWTEGFGSTLHSLEPGTTDITVVGTMNDGTTTCSAFRTLEVFNPRAWWQVRDGSAVSSAGSISTSPPEVVCAANPNCEPTLIRGDYPGVSMAGGSVTPNAPLTVVPYDSKAGDWSVEGSGFAGVSAYNYTYFKRKASSASFSDDPGSSLTTSKLTTGTKYQGYRWYKATGLPVKIDAPINMGSERAIVFVNGNLQINSTVNLTDGTGFVLFIVSGNIDISEAVGGNSPDLKGFYAADGTIDTIWQGTDDDDLPLYVRGSVLAHTAIDLGRKLADNTVTPAETFEYAYDQALNFPALLAPQAIVWKEIGP